MRRVPAELPPGGSKSRILASIGRAVRARRDALGLTRDVLAAQSGLSVRFLSLVEAGVGNISVLRLESLARALSVSPAELLVHADGAERLKCPVVALLGLRGAGKTSLGEAAARKLGIAFVEHDRLVEEAAGMNLAELFSLHGDGYYRRLARETLARFLDQQQRPCILATGGGLVTDPDALRLLKLRAGTVWLSATPDDHWNRVVAQGDRRPMKDRPEAMAELRRLLSERLPLYRTARHVIETSRLGFRRSLIALLRIIEADSLAAGPP